MTGQNRARPQRFFGTGYPGFVLLCAKDISDLPFNIFVCRKLLYDRRFVDDVECIARVAKGFTQCCDIAVYGGVAAPLEPRELHLFALGLTDFVQRKVLEERTFEKNVVNARIKKERLSAVAFDPVVEGLFALEKCWGLGSFFLDQARLLLDHAGAEAWAQSVACLRFVRLDVKLDGNSGRNLTVFTSNRYWAETLIVARSLQWR